MVGVNPFAGKRNLLDTTPVDPMFVDSSRKLDASDPIQYERPSAWSRVLGIIFGGGVAQLPAVAAYNKPMTKRRFRRLRGKAKAARAQAQYQ